MKKIAILFSLLLLIVCFAACKDNDVYLSETDSSAPADTSSGFGIIITDKQETTSGTESKTSSVAPTQSEIEQIASDWDDVEIEIEVAPENKPESKPESKPEKTSSKETATSSEEKTPASSSQVDSSSEQETPSESSSSEQPKDEEPTSSKVTSLPDYYEGRY